MIYKLEEIRTRLFEEADEQDGLGQAEVLSGNRGMAAGLRMAAGIIAEKIEDERQWRRINAMSPVELKAELLKAGYTEERLNAGLERFKKTLSKYVAEKSAANASGETHRISGPGSTEKDRA